MNAQEYSDWIDSLYRQSRALISREQELFSIAGKELAARFSDEHAKNPDNDENVKDLPRQGFSSQKLLITRICFARTAAVNQDGSPESSSLNIGPTNRRHERVLAARQVILAILLAADPDANEYITPDICELARSQFETTEQGVLGRSWVPWNWKDQDRHLCPGVICHNCPTPEALRVLESSLVLAGDGVVLEKAVVNPLASNPQYQKAKWFTRSTRGLLTGDVLRKAVNRKALICSTQSKKGDEWSHSVSEVCRVYPEYEPKIMEALAREQV
ncbi:MAG: hypothetical protein JKY43_07725 [Phycisphaerales bacterium]|nr:hypothetical protein [Phycisphaerales bacterium]